MVFWGRLREYRQGAGWPETEYGRPPAHSKPSWWRHPLLYWPVICWMELALDIVWLHQRAVKFLLIGTLTVPLGIGLLWALTDMLGLWYLLSHGITVVITTSLWVLGQNGWTFSDRHRRTERFWRGVLVRAIMIIVYTSLLAGMTEILGVWYLLSASAAMLVTAPMAYLLSSRWAWRD